MILKIGKHGCHYQNRVKGDGMSDLISRQAAIDALDGEITVTGRANAEAVRGYANLVCDRIKRLPSAQPKRKTGRWIYGEHDVTMCDGYHCSECGFFVPWDYKRKFIDFIKDYNFCPNCGSPMEKEGEG